MGRLVAALACSLLACGCATVMSPAVPARVPPSVIVVDPVETTECLRISARRQGFGYTPLDEQLDDALLARLADVPADVRSTARAAGLESTLAKLLQARASPSEAATLALVALRLQVVMRMSSLEIQLAALLFEADCTGDQMENVLRELDQRTRRREIAFTFASIAVGALIGVGAGLWDLNSADSRGPAALGIAGGAASASLGIVALTPRRSRVVFRHAHNLLVPIVRGEDPEHLYPPFVFDLLTMSRSPGGTTPRDYLLAEWRKLIDAEIGAPDRALAESVLYGSGGVYDGALVNVRERMFDALESQLNAFDHDLEELYRFFGRLLDEP